MNIQKSFNNIIGRDTPYSAFIIAVAVVIASILISIAMIARKQNTNTIISTGSARESVVSDTAKISGEISVRIFSDELKYGYTKIAKDKTKVQEYLTAQGATESEVVFGSAYASEVWDNDNGPRQFDIKIPVSVQSKNLDTVKKISDNSSQVIQNDVFLQMYAIEYYYSNLPAKRKELLGKAVIDAKERASEIASSAGDSVGSLRSARAGVVQLLAPNSQNVDDYGSYDTSTIEKDIVVTVNATFQIK